MSRLPHPGGLRTNRRPKFVTVDSGTVRDDTLSYRALGVLTYLLDQKEGWQVRSDQLSKGEGREGRGAVRTALRELSTKGYYRLERRRLLNGKHTMGTAVSEYPVPQWLEDHKIFSTTSDPAIPVIEQQDGTFLVEYPDGTLGSDGFEADPYDEPEVPAEEPQAGEEPGMEPGEAPPADAVSPPVPPASRPRRAKRTPPGKRNAAKAKDPKTKALEEAAEEVAKWWWSDAEKHLGRYVGKTNGYVAMRSQVLKALEAGYTQRQCADALRHAQKHLPSAQQWQNALGVASNRIIPNQPKGRVPYSDSDTWGSSDGGSAEDTPPPPDDSDDVTFGVIARP
ncbi:hypothetical protein ACWGMW_07880 [Streptomyces albidoflavus]